MRSITWKMATGMEGDVEAAVGGMEAPARVPITLTHVQYTEGDYLGMLLAWCSLLPIFIMVGFVTLILFRRDLHTIFFCTGMVFNEGCNFVLKHIFKQPRPSNDVYTHSLFVEYGMPSSHAQFMACFATYFTLFIFIRAILSTGIRDYVWKSLTALVAIAAAIFVSVSRIYLGYHTMEQILYGVMIGLFLGAVWFALVQLVFGPYFPHIYSWSVSEIFLLKDFSEIPNYMWYEFTSVRQETRPPGSEADQLIAVYQCQPKLKSLRQLFRKRMRTKTQ